MAHVRDSARTFGKSDPIDALAVARAVLREPPHEPGRRRHRRPASVETATARPALGRAVTGEPDEQPMAIDGTNGDTPRDDPAATLWATLEGA
jgi:hypothetical protein